MRKPLLLIVGGASLALAACGIPPINLPASPAEVADKTVLDEQGAIGVELAYKAFRTALEVATDAGVLRGDNATRAAVLDSRAYAAVGTARSAYASGNAASYKVALDEARTAINAALSAVKGK